MFMAFKAIACSVSPIIPDHRPFMDFSAPGRLPSVIMKEL